MVGIALNFSSEASYYGYFLCVQPLSCSRVCTNNVVGFQSPFMPTCVSSYIQEIERAKSLLTSSSSSSSSTWSLCYGSKNQPPEPTPQGINKIYFYSKEKPPEKEDEFWRKEWKGCWLLLLLCFSRISPLLVAAVSEVEVDVAPEKQSPVTQQQGERDELHTCT